LWLSLAAPLAAAEPIALMRAHAHNDYEHTRPLFDALDQGFGNIEADIWLVDGHLLVAHDEKHLQSERTLEKLYLDPLRERVRQEHGRVYRNGPTIVLLIDVKSEAESTYAALHRVLEKYSGMLTTFRGDRAEPKAITVIVSGNRARETMLAQRLRYASYDGRAADLEGDASATFIPWISENWLKVFTWKWEGPMPHADRAALRTFVDRAHAQKRLVRFWNTPDRPDAWKLLLDAGVDIMSTDDLPGLARFLKARNEP
jgi:glycerophosphoryl diester phosphodiesterase